MNRVSVFCLRVGSMAGQTMHQWALMWLHAINVCSYIIAVHDNNSAGYVLYATVAQGGCAPVNLTTLHKVG